MHEFNFLNSEKIAGHETPMQPANKPNEWFGTCKCWFNFFGTVLLTFALHFLVAQTFGILVH